jgi:Flp pilus assembly protein TadD
LFLELIVIKHTVIAAMLATTAMAFSRPVLAADTAENSSVSAAPSVAERMALARQAIANKDWRKAIDQLTGAARDEPRNADVHNLLGYSHRKQNTPNLAKAFEHYNIALKLNPQHKGAHEYIGEAYLMDKKPTEAEKHLVLLEAICGNKTCEEYADLAKAIASYKARTPV